MVEVAPDHVPVTAACARAGSDRQTKEYLKKDALQELQMKRAGRRNWQCGLCGPVKFAWDRQR